MSFSTDCKDSTGHCTSNSRNNQARNNRLVKLGDEAAEDVKRSVAPMSEMIVLNIVRFIYRTV